MERHDVCILLDKLTLDMLRLMEDRVRSQVNIENATNNASIHLAKTRYIMGQNSVSICQLPTECSPEFLALSTVTTKVREDIVSNEAVELNVRKSQPDSEYTNPIRWFGVLVPRDLYQAQTLFTNTLNYVIESVNLQRQLEFTRNAIMQLKKLKQKLTPEE